ncbi:M23 family metallopeptidase, partial [Candidatus Gracilibacteria bacterium]|nr:M23 family metallopeptidase [Candidatus Gracilibacteria bacterium]
MKKPNVKIWALIGVIVSGLLYVGDFSSFLYRASVLSFPEHAAFDGTVHPVKQVPNWVAMNGNADDAQYSSLNSSNLVNIPAYDANQLKRSVDTLTWGNAADDEVRNAKITYSVPYMGSYTLDGVEDAGSHPAVDIKLPYGTPIASIANGVVTKVSMKESGFGHHVVVMHNNVPSFDNANEKVTYYSSYSHVGTVLVSVGEVVTKGQQVALSGNTGTSTTPHLHFQIDNADAPWHPFWPFTFQEAIDAGLNFYEAVNYGLNADKARATTINPLEYVKKYYDSSSISAPAVVESVAASVVEAPVEVVVEVVVEVPVVVSEPVVVEAPVVVVKEEPVVEVIVVEPSYDQELNFTIDVMSSYYVDDSSEIVIRAVDQKGRQFEDSLPEVIFFKSENDNFVPSKKFVESSRFGVDAQYTIELRNMKAGEDRLYVETNGKKTYSDRFNIIASDKPELFTDLGEDHKYYKEIASLVDKGVI